MGNVYITVNTDQDHSQPRRGLTTLRQAIVKLNDLGGKWDKAYINFDSSDTSTASWVIAPEWPLPPILHGNVYLNYTDPKNITLSGRNLNPDAKNKSFKGFNITSDKYKEYKAAGNFKYHIVEANPHSSLLTIGDGRHLDERGISRPPKLGPVVIKNINFIDNYAIGEDARSSKNKYGMNTGGGGGGGLGAGAGISIVSDIDVEIYDSVFQNLEVRGGKGASGNDGGKGIFKKKKNIIRFYPPLSRDGAPGTFGGRQGSFVVSRPDMYDRAFVARPGGIGGDSFKSEANRGKGALAMTQPLHGRKGSMWPFTAPFGVGGAGGGGGGAGDHHQYWLKDYLGKGGNGGRGQNAGFGGGGGGGGGGGMYGVFGDFWKRSTFTGGPYLVDIKYGFGGKGGAGHLISGYATDGSNGGYDGIKWQGGKGGDGLALGGGIAVLNPKAKLHLERVDFRDIRSGSHYAASQGKYLYVISDDNKNHTYVGTPKKGVVTANSTYTYDSSNQERSVLKNICTTGVLVNLQNSGCWRDVRAIVTEKKSVDAIDSLIKKGTSFNRDNFKPRIRDQFIALKSMNPEIVTIQYERPKSLMRNVDIDSSKLESEINDIYKKIIPIEDPNDIRNRMYKKIFLKTISLGSDLWGTRTNSNNLFSASKAEFTDIDRKELLVYGVGAFAAQFAWNTLEAINTYQDEMLQNRANIKELADKTKPNRDLVSAEPINVGTSRSVVRVENFRIGEDIIFLEGFSKKFGPKFIRGSASENDDKKTLTSIEIHTSNETNQGNAATRIAEISIDPENAKFTKNAVSYFYDLLSWDETSNRWMINNMLTKGQGINSQAKSYDGGPAGELVTLERPADIPFSQNWTVNTQDHDDIIVATNGDETISTFDGNDQIFPGIGNDTINGGASFDWVNYLDIKQEIDVNGGIVNDPNNPSLISKFDVSFLNKTNTKKELDSTLTAVESISAFGASKFNLKELPLPSGVGDKNQTAYVIRSGSGTKIEGSPHSDHFIISLMEDENTDNYLSASTSVSVSSSSSGKNSDKSDSYLLLDNPSTISGGGGDDQLTFAFTRGTPKLTLVDLENPGKDLENYQAVIQDNRMIIAYVKDIDTSDIKIGSNSRFDSKNVLRLDGIALNINTLPAKDFNIMVSEGKDEFYALENNSIDPKSAPAGSSDSDTILGSHKDDMLDGLGGNDVLDGDKGSDQLIGGSGNDSLNGNQGDDIILGKRGNDFIYGADGFDVLYGNAGDDFILGNLGNDVIDGGSGDDFIAGGKGLNQVNGGAGYDTFYLQKGGHQVIQDFDPYKDKLILSDGLDRDLIEVNDDNQIIHGSSVIAELS